MSGHPRRSEQGFPAATSARIAGKIVVAVDIPRFFVV
jgi:hypothetical protein